MSRKKSIGEQEIAKRHAALAAKRQEEKAKDPTCDFDSVIELMERAAKELAALPDDAEFTAEALDRLEEARHHAIRLTEEIETVFELLRGK